MANTFPTPRGHGRVAGLLPALTLALAGLGLISPPAHAAVEIAEDLLVDVNATDLEEGSTASVANNGSLGGDFDARGGGTTIPVVAFAGGTKGLRFDGNDYMQLLDGPGGGILPVPAGIVGTDPTRTIEVWAYNPSVVAEETMVSWGKRGGGTGSNMSFNYGSNGAFGAVGHWGSPDIGWNNAGGNPEAKKWHHLVYTYDGTTTRVYSDGVLANQEVLGSGAINTHAGTSINLCTQLEGDGVTATAGLRGSLTIGRVRIHDGVLSASQILANYNAERPEFIDPAPPTPENLQGIPVNRYSFSEAAGDASGLYFEDSINGQDGQVKGAGASFSGSRLILPGGSSASAAYGDLPNGLLSLNGAANGGNGEVTIEGWVKITGARTWSRIFDFGSTEPGGAAGEIQGPGGSGAGLDYLFYSAQVGDDVNTHRLELRNEDPAGGGITTADAASPGTFNKDLHFAVTWKESTGEIKAFENGIEVAAMIVDDRISDVNDVNVWLGRSAWQGDQNMQGEFDEFRIYDRVLSANEILGNFQAGANTVNTGGQPVQITADPSSQTGYLTYPVTFSTTASGTPPIHYTWRRNGVEIPGANSPAYTFVPTSADQGAVFSCVVSNYANAESTILASGNATLTVVSERPVTLDHRWSFNEDPGDTAVMDSVGGAHGTLVGGGTFSGAGRLALNGTDSYVNLPNDLVLPYANITIEAWVMDAGSGGWARIFDFGNSTGGEDFPLGSGVAGTQYMFLSAPSGFGNLRGAYTISGGGGGEQLLEWPGSSIPVGQLRHVVWATHGGARYGRLYVDGSLVGSNANQVLSPRDLGPTVNNWLGRAQFNDPLFRGEYEEFRIWNGAMTPSEVAASFAAGPSTPYCPTCLSIRRADGSIEISYPAASAGLQLQGSEMVGPGADWQPVGATPVVDGDQLKVTVPANGRARFFRLFGE